MLTTIENYLIIFALVIGIFFIILGLFWFTLRSFFHNNYSYFDFGFIIIYFLEQITLIILITFEPGKIVFWVSSFALMVVTTASIQKMSMDSRDKKIREENEKIKQNSERKTRKINELIYENLEMANYIKKLEKIISKNNYNNKESIW